MPSNTLYVAADKVDPTKTIQYTAVEVNTFAAQRGFKWNDDFLSMPRQALEGERISEKPLSFVDLSSMGLVPMSAPPGSESLDLGYAVHCRKTIPENSAVTHYAAKASPPNMTGTYSMHFNDKFSLDASSEGNIARFFPHLMTPIDLMCLVMPRFIREQVACENLQGSHEVRENTVALVLWNICPLEEGDMIGLSYGLSYFLSQGSIPFLYTKKGFPLAMDKVFLDKRRYAIFEMMTSISRAAVSDPDPRMQRILVDNFITLFGLSCTTGFVAYEAHLRQHWPALREVVHQYQPGLDMNMRFLDHMLTHPQNALLWTEIDKWFLERFPLAVDPKKFGFHTPVVPSPVEHAASPLSGALAGTSDQLTCKPSAV